jgi:hypothetical protein
LLTSAQVQTFLQDQAVQVFASAAARTSALGTAVSAGMVSYRADEKALELYANSVWTPISQGRNIAINSSFDIWQRGTSFTSRDGWTADRNYFFGDGSGAASTISQQTFTPGTAPFAGYEAQFFYRYNQTTAGSGGSLNILDNILEDVRTLAGQTVTLSFFAKADSARSVTATFRQNFGSGGSGSVNTSVGTASVTTAWQRFSFTITMPSVSGKTIGSSSNLVIRLGFPINTTQTIDIWGVQLEAGSVATPFVRAGGTLQGELAACQRYYQRYNSVTSNAIFNGNMFGSTTFYGAFVYPRMRVAPSATVSSAASFNIFGAGTSSISTGAALQNLSEVSAEVFINTTGAITANSGAWARWNGTTGQYFFELNAEL